MGKNNLQYIQGTMGPKGQDRDLVLARVKVVKKPSRVCKRGTFGSPINEPCSQSWHACEYIHLYNKVASFRYYVHLYIQKMAQVKYVHKNICTATRWDGPCPPPFIYGERHYIHIYRL